MTQNSKLTTQGLRRRSPCELFPEEIVERGARVQRPAVHRPAGIMSFPLDGRSSDKKVALVSYVFFCDAFGNRLGAFELRAGVEVAAVLAGPQVRAALRAFAFQTDFHWRRNDSPAHGTPENFLKTRHTHRPRAIPFLAFRRARLRFPRAHDTVASLILVTTLTVFSFGHLAIITSREVGRLQGSESF